jgi:hypothetical protein
VLTSEWALSIHLQERVTQIWNHCQWQQLRAMSPPTVSRMRSAASARPISSKCPLVVLACTLLIIESSTSSARLNSSSALDGLFVTCIPHIAHGGAQSLQCYAFTKLLERMLHHDSPVYTNSSVGGHVRM